jgi:hypothetical protein
VSVFPDTHVLGSAFAASGLCADLMRRLLTEHEVPFGEDLLAVASDAPIPIVTPREAWGPLAGHRGVTRRRQNRTVPTVARKNGA